MVTTTTNKHTKSKNVQKVYMRSAFKNVPRLSKNRKGLLVFLICSRCRTKIHIKSSKTISVKGMKSYTEVFRSNERMMWYLHLHNKPCCSLHTFVWKLLCLLHATEEFCKKIFRDELHFSAINSHKLKTH